MPKGQTLVLSGLVFVYRVYSTSLQNIEWNKLSNISSTQVLEQILKHEHVSQRGRFHQSTAVSWVKQLGQLFQIILRSKGTS